MPRPRFSPSPSLVVACAALLVALGGTSIAAVSVVLPRNSVGAVQLRPNAVNSTKVLNGSLLAADFKSGQLPGGSAGEGGFVVELPTGKTLRGTFAGRAYAPGPGQDLQIPITFAFSLADAPVAHYVAYGSPPQAACPGTPSSPAAEPGHLCVYESIPALNADGRVFDPISGAEGEADPYGAGVSATSRAVGDFRVRGSWAVTAE
jgi:hypothetical protein